MIALGENIFIVFTCNLYGCRICVFQSSVGKGKELARDSQLLFHHFTAVSNLMLQFLNIVIVNAIMIQGMGSKYEPSILKFLNLCPCHRMLARTLRCIHCEVLYKAASLLSAASAKFGLMKNMAFTPYFSS